MDTSNYNNDLPVEMDTSSKDRQSPTATGPSMASKRARVAVSESQRKKMTKVVFGGAAAKMTRPSASNRCQQQINPIVKSVPLSSLPESVVQPSLSPPSTSSVVEKILHESISNARLNMEHNKVFGTSLKRAADAMLSSTGTSSVKSSSAPSCEEATLATSSLTTAGRYRLLNRKKFDPYRNKRMSKLLHEGRLQEKTRDTINESEEIMPPVAKRIRAEESTDTCSFPTKKIELLSSIKSIAKPAVSTDHLTELVPSSGYDFPSHYGPSSASSSGLIDIMADEGFSIGAWPEPYIRWRSTILSSGGDLSDSDCDLPFKSSSEWPNASSTRSSCSLDSGLDEAELPENQFDIHFPEI